MHKLTLQFKQELKLRNYAPRTIDCYATWMEKIMAFSRTCRNLPREERLRQFFLAQTNNLVGASQANAALQLFFGLILKEKCPYHLNRSRTRKRIPIVLRKDEIVRILDTIPNEKHYALIAMMYGSGLRVSEVVALRVGDVDLVAQRVFVRDAKQHKDRYTTFSPRLAAIIRQLKAGRTGTDLLFVNRFGQAYATRTLQYLFEKAVNSAGIDKLVTCHTLRHSFATHLLENGMDIKTIRDLLGHSNLKTTLIYMHTADIMQRNIPSPFWAWLALKSFIVVTIKIPNRHNKVSRVIAI